MAGATKSSNRIELAIKNIWENTSAFLTSVFLLALFLRLGVMVATHSYHLGNSIDDYFGYGTEMGRVARSLAQGQGFSSPMPLPTGPTAIVGPIYPLILALIFKIFGIYTVSSAAVILGLQCVVSSLTCFFIYLCGRDSVGEAAGKLAALVWAWFPLNILFSSTRIWETSTSGMLAAALCWCMLSLFRSPSIWRATKIGVLLAISALINTSLVVLAVPFVVAAILKYRTRSLLPIVAAGISFGMLISPWLLRNHHQFGKFMLRSNFPLEFRVGNNELTRGQKVIDMHPARSVALNQQWHDLGEKRFMEEQSALNARYVSAHRRDFAFSVVNRIVNYWTGAWIAPAPDYPNLLGTIAGISLLSLLGFAGVYKMISGGNSVAFIYLGCFALYPVVYYLTTSQPRFYHTIAPLLVISGSFCLVDMVKKLRSLRADRDNSKSTFTKRVSAVV